MFNEFDTPIFIKSYDLYKLFYSFRTLIPKNDRYTIWQRCENLMLDIIEGILYAGQLSKIEKLPILEKTSMRLNLLRVFVRLMKDTKAIDNKKYVSLETIIDEIGRQLGGWINSTKG